MKFLFICTKGSIFDLPDSLQHIGHSVSVLKDIYFDPNKSLSEQNSALEEILQHRNYNFVISYLFIPAVSDLCYKYSLPYISWTYDSPLNALFTPAVFHPTNYTFIFDHEEYLRLKALQVPHIYHLPLAANTERINNLNISPEDEAAYSHNITFIGSLYNDNYYDMFFPYFSEDVQNELKQILSNVICNWSQTRGWSYLSAQSTNELTGIIQSADWNPTTLLSNEMYAWLAILPKKLAQLERISVLNTLTQFFPVHLYSNQTSSFLQNVIVHPPVDYTSDACKIFALSKINLNLTLPSIESGIPQRIFDIMACGGFVLTNYQKELEDLFVIGTDIEVFHNTTELIAKCSYYLSHETERLNIAINGYRKVCSQHTYTNRIEQMRTVLSTEI